MKRWKSRIADPMTYLGLASFGAVFGIKELAQFGVPEIATSLAAVGGILASLFGETKDERAESKKPTSPPAS